MSEEQIKKQIATALVAVSDVQDPSLKTVAFGIVLRHLLSGLPQDQKVSASSGKKTVDAVADNVTIPTKNPHIIKSLSLSEEELAEIYKVEGDALHLNIKIKGDKTADQQRKLAHAVLFGYKVMLDTREVAGSKILKVAKDWDTPTDHFVHNVGPSEYIQVRNVGKGKDPIYSLKPGALEKLCDEVKSLVAS